MIHGVKKEKRSIKEIIKKKRIIVNVSESKKNACGAWEGRSAWQWSYRDSKAKHTTERRMELKERERKRRERGIGHHQMIKNPLSTLFELHLSPISLFLLPCGVSVLNQM